MSIWRRKRREQDLERELRDHLDLETSEQSERRLPQAEARHAAQRAFGNTAAVQERVREAWGWAWLDRWCRDVRHALRVLRLNPGLASVAVLALGLGVGANTALYSILNAIYLRPLPVEKPQQLVVFVTNNTSQSYPMYRELRDHARSLQAVIAYRTLQANIGVNGSTERGKAVMVSGNYFSALGVRTALGAPISPEDHIREGSGGERGPVAVLSYAYWSRRFGADRGVVGSRIHLNGSPFTIVGVAERDFTGTEIGESPDVFAPMMMQPALMPSNTGALRQPLNVWLRIMGRLRPDVSVQQAEAELTVLVQHFLRQNAPDLTPERRRRFLEQRATLLDGRAGTSGLRRRYAQPMTILMTVAGLVLLIACANVASLLLTRATGRQREIAVRLALGATRGRLVSQLLSESLVLAALGGALGLGLSRVVRDIILQFLPQAAEIRVTLDAPVLGFSLLLAIATGLLFGLIPALQATRHNIRHSMGAGRFQLRKGLVVLQISFSLLLLTGAGVFIRSLRNLKNIDAGFVRDNVLVFSVNPRLRGYQEEEAKVLYDRLLDRLRNLTGVRSVSRADFAPLNMHTGNRIVVEGYQPRPDELSADPGIGVAAPGYFATMGIPVLLGRDFGTRDSASAPKVAIVNETFAQHYFGKDGPLGKRLGFGKDRYDIEIVGVVRDSKYGGLREKPQRMLYLEAAQRPSFGPGFIHVRTSGDALAFAPIAREVVRELDRDLPVSDMSTVQLEFDRALMQDRLVATLSAMFSTLALILSAVGLYGVMAYAVTRRIREIGIRMALGADRASIAKQVLREAGLLMLAGTAIGLPAAYVMTRLVSGMLFGLSPADPASAAIAMAVLAAVALLAAWIPARRASRVDPMVALRYE